VIQIEDKIISQDLFDVLFVCDYDTCKGECCVEGDSGAPLEEGEAEQLRQGLPPVRPPPSPAPPPLNSATPSPCPWRR